MRQVYFLHSFLLYMFSPGELNIEMISPIYTAEPDGLLSYNNRSGKNWQQQVKRRLQTLRKPEYQLVFVNGIVEGTEIEALKTVQPMEQFYS